MKSLLLPVALLALVAAAPAGPFAEVSAARRAAQEAPAADKAAKYDAAMALAPTSLETVRQALSASTEDPKRLVMLIDRFVALGATFSEPTAAQLLPMLTDAADRERLAKALIDNRKPLAFSQPRLTIPPQIPLVEAIAYDAKRDCLYFSSVVGQALYARCGAVPAKTLPLPANTGPILGIALDAAADRLWFVSAPVFGGGTPSGLFGLDLPTSKVTAIPMPAGVVELGDVAVGQGSEVFAADSRSGAIYRLRHGKLAVLVPPGVLHSAQGIAPSPDGKHLHVADYSYGIVRIDLGTGAVQPMKVVDNLGLDGIDGLLRHGDDLIAIQNGWRPSRILRLRLSVDEKAITVGDVLERGHPQHDDPTQGAIVAGQLLYVANSQWPKYAQNGEQKPGEGQAPTVILALQLLR
ncbi:hypothetical protein ACFOMD_15200 [Sphingoaurantiacus capsulatus]|uniref:Uncharacterized protein n=1 Tax=Sphingoaurantiacus capsulatus TaxID=1771310 RepID=A0ABV7XDP6_9SPHN